MTITTRRLTWGCLITSLLLFCSQPGWSRRGPRRATEPDYTKGEEPATKDTRWAIGPTGAHGYFYYRDARQVWVDPYMGTDKGSPADGKLRGGDVILGVLYPKSGQDTGNGKFTFDARRSMAIAIEEAEKKEHGGKLVLNVWRPKGETTIKMIPPPGLRPRYRDPKTGMMKHREKVPVNLFVPDKPLSGTIMPVELALPVMGSYSATSPYACEKNEALVKKLAGNIVKNGCKGAHFDALGLLATGDKAYLPILQNYARKTAAKTAKYDAFSRDKEKGSKTWYVAYENLFLCEYYLITKDEQVLPGIKGASMYLAQGVSGVGTWSHGIANVIDNDMYGPACAYGAMNQISLVCAMSLVLAEKCGLEDPAIDKAVRLALDFNRYYVDRGCIPYGDHAPTEQYDNNGRMSIAAVLYDLVGDKQAAEYFARMTTASYQTREQGHTGHFFSWNWGALGAARGGPEAAASFLKNTRYFFELERRHDGECVYQPQLPDQSHKTYGSVTTGQRLIQYCLPRKVLYITGKGGSCVTPITGSELKKVVSAPHFNPKPLSAEELLNALGSWSLLVRKEAAQELGARDDNVVDELIAMLDSPKRFARYGACDGLRFAGRKSTKAVDALIDKIENDDDMVLKYFAINALRLPPEKGPEVNGLGQAPRRATEALLKLATVYDPDQDPHRKLGRVISDVLFHGDPRDHVPQAFFPSGKGAEKLDKAVLIPAIKALLLNPNSVARGNGMRVVSRLPLEDLNQFWDEIYRATTNPAPSGVMFADQTHINGIKTMAEHKVEEGMEFGWWYVIEKDAWGNAGRKTHGGIAALLMYGRAMEPYFKELERRIGRHLSGGQAKGARKALAAARKAPMPELISIQKYIESKPEKAFLEWKAKQGEK